VGNGFPRRREAGSEHDVEALAPEENGEHVAQSGLIVDDENPGPGRGS
jgi:hypothetical protein